MKSKKYYIDLINHTKIIKESETLDSNGEIDLYLRLSPVEYSSNKMTINDLAKIVNNLALEMRECFKQVNQRLDRVEIRLDKIEKRLDEHDAILREHSEIFRRNNLI